MRDQSVSVQVAFMLVTLVTVVTLQTTLTSLLVRLHFRFNAMRILLVFEHRVAIGKTFLANVTLHLRFGPLFYLGNNDAVQKHVFGKHRSMDEVLSTHATTVVVCPTATKTLKML